MHPATRLLNRIPNYSLARLTLLAALKSRLPLIEPGVTLDVGGGRAPFRDLVPHTSYLTLDIAPEKKPDIVSDLHEVEWSSDYFDTIIATEVLEHLHDPRKAIGEMFRLLRDGGVCFLSTRFIHPIHGSPQDFYRFTADGLRHLFSEFAEIEVVPLGNRIQALWLLATHNHLAGKSRRLWQLLTLPLTRLLARIHVDHTLMPLGYLVVARKRVAPPAPMPSAPMQNG